jgi:hypothetical protein
MKKKLSVSQRIQVLNNAALLRWYGKTYLWFVVGWPIEEIQKELAKPVPGCYYTGMKKRAYAAFCEIVKDAETKCI